MIILTGVDQALANLHTLNRSKVGSIQPQQLLGTLPIFFPAWSSLQVLRSHDVRASIEGAQ